MRLLFIVSLWLGGDLPLLLVCGRRLSECLGHLLVGGQRLRGGLRLLLGGGLWLSSGLRLLLASFRLLLCGGRRLLLGGGQRLRLCQRWLSLLVLRRLRFLFFWFCKLRVFFVGVGGMLLILCLLLQLSPRLGSGWGFAGGNCILLFSFSLSLQ